MSALALTMLLATATGAVADDSPPIVIPRCADRATIVEALENGYNEHQIAYGVHVDGLYLLEIFATPDGSTWSLLTTTAQTGLSCLSGSGKHLSPGSAALAPGDPS